MQLSQEQLRELINSIYVRGEISSKVPALMDIMRKNTSLLRFIHFAENEYGTVSVSALAPKRIG